MFSSSNKEQKNFNSHWLLTQFFLSPSCYLESDACLVIPCKDGEENKKHIREEHFNKEAYLALLLH